MRWVAFLLCVQGIATAVKLDPASPKQGDAIQITVMVPASAARMNRRTIPLYPQPEGTRFGLMPVGANDKPGAYTLEVLGADGVVLESVRVIVRNARFLKQNVRLSPGVSALKASPGEMETVSAFRKAVSQERHWREPLELPIAGCMTSPYGVRRFHNGKPTGNYHAGIDQASPAGTPIRTTAGGTVRLVREYNIHGHVVGVDHGQGLSSIYLHMSGFNVAEGARVERGAVLGYVGATGRATAPHLHWSLYANGVAVNPAEWVKPPPCH